MHLCRAPREDNNTTGSLSTDSWAQQSTTSRDCANEAAGRLYVVSRVRAWKSFKKDLHIYFRFVVLLQQQSPSRKPVTHGQQHACMCYLSDTYCCTYYTGDRQGSTAHTRFHTRLACCARVYIDGELQISKHRWALLRFSNYPAGLAA